MIHTAHDVAKWFLNQRAMSHTKLQKLCYYAQAWHCALYDEPIFDDEIQAWVHGPVVVSLYNTYKTYRGREIPKQNNALNSFGEALSILNLVDNSYGHLSAGKLERITHSEYPWQQARGLCLPNEHCTNTISTESMKQYYIRVYAQAQRRIKVKPMSHEEWIAKSMQLIKQNDKAYTVLANS